MLGLIGYQKRGRKIKKRKVILKKYEGKELRRCPICMKGFEYEDSVFCSEQCKEKRG